MGDNRIKLVKNYLDNLITFLEPLLPLANCHMVDYFTKSSFAGHIPNDLRLETEQCGFKNVIDCIFESNYDKLPNLRAFLDRCNRFTLKNCPDVCLGVTDFKKKLASLGGESFNGLKLNVFMSSKKSHEVEVFSALAASVSDIVETSHLIDIGDGKGYLSSLLAYNYNLKVLGIDGSNINTAGASKRATKLYKQWNRIVDSNEGKPTDNAYSKFSLYKQVTQYVDDNVDLSELVQNVFLDKPSSLGLVGLHTCGNLGPTCVRLFHSNPNVRTIMNVSCCYHLLTEQFEESDCSVETRCGFPMSQFLNNKHFSIGRRARMVGAQSFDRIIHSKELPNVSIFYRALLQVILEERCEAMPVKHVGRMKKFSDFSDYVKRALNVLNIDIGMSDELVDEYYANYVDRISELHVFYLIRSMLSSVIETLILLDRLVYLLENDLEDSFLVQLFDPVISPRCYGLVCIK